MTRATTFRATAVIGGVLLAILMIMTVSRAAFSDTTSNEANEWSSATVNLTDDYTENGLGAMFKLIDNSNLTPGDSDSKCIEIIYTGTVDATVGLSDISKTGSSGLAPAIDLDIERYAGSNGDCLPTPGVYVFGGTLFDGDTAVGFDTWTATAGGDHAYYKVTWTFVESGNDLVDNGYQGKTAEAAFTWQATS